MKKLVDRHQYVEGSFTVASLIEVLKMGVWPSDAEVSWVDLTVNWQQEESDQEYQTRLQKETERKQELEALEENTLKLKAEAARIARELAEYEKDE